MKKAAINAAILLGSADFRCLNGKKNPANKLY
jgi:hypothetical protein